MKKCERKTLCTSTTGHCTVKCTALQVTYTRKRPQIADGTDFIKADLLLLFLKLITLIERIFFMPYGQKSTENLFENHWSLTAQK